jgi:hypothetical protein
MESALLRFERRHIHGESVLHIGLDQYLVGFVDLLDRDDFHIGGRALRLTTGHLLKFFGVPRSLHRDLCGGIIDLTQIVGGEFE